MQLEKSKDNHVKFVFLTDNQSTSLYFCTSVKVRVLQSSEPSSEPSPVLASNIVFQSTFNLPSSLWLSGSETVSWPAILGWGNSTHHQWGPTSSSSTCQKPSAPSTACEWPWREPLPKLLLAVNLFLGSAASTVAPQLFLLRNEHPNRDFRTTSDSFVESSSRLVWQRSEVQIPHLVMRKSHKTSRSQEVTNDKAEF